MKRFLALSLMLLVAVMFVSAKKPLNYYANLAFEADSLGDERKAIELFELELKEHKDNAKIAYELCKKYNIYKEYEKSIPLLQRIIENTKNDVAIRDDAYRMMVNLSWRMDDKEMVLNFLNKCLSRKGNDTYLLLMRAQYNSKSNPQSAAEDIEKALSLTPDDVVFLMTAGEIWESMQEDEKALQLFDKVTELDPTVRVAYYKRGKYYQKVGQTQPMLENYIAYMAQPDAPAFSWSTVSYDLRKIDDIKDRYIIEEAIRTSEKVSHEDKAYILDDLYVEWGMFAEMKEYFTQQYRDGIFSLPVYQTLSSIYANEGNYAKALELTKEYFSRNKYDARFFLTGCNYCYVTRNLEGQLELTDLALDAIDRPEGVDDESLEFYGKGNLYFDKYHLLMCMGRHKEALDIAHKINDLSSNLDTVYIEDVFRCAEAAYLAGEPSEVWQPLYEYVIEKVQATDSLDLSAIESYELIDMNGYRAIALGALGRTQEVNSVFANLREVFPEDYYYWDIKKWDINFAARFLPDEALATIENELKKSVMEARLFIENYHLRSLLSNDSYCELLQRYNVPVEFSPELNRLVLVGSENDGFRETLPDEEPVNVPSIEEIINGAGGIETMEDPRQV